ncbi:Williams-Beuren syndrome chromosomal region 16 [Liparis tanakae]|uniref:Williams-Beuren syndrome chromosomal region 16 n=1 Tax=Liparis tanakae TaxID=230148 RepID=A0A4Z2E119_9TELE|nr:Williams-Beuren syndrome chromosomal region 16 [Liparis tanakae]
MIPSSLFGASEFHPAVAVTAVRCGLDHFAAVTDRGELFVWGKNVRGCLGIGKRDDQYFPWRVRPQGLLPLEGKTTRFTSPGG